MKSNFDINSIPDKLIKAIKHNNCGLLVGAGLSVGAGYPSWKSLLQELIEKASKETTTSTDKIGELYQLMEDPSKYLLVAEELKEILPSEFYTYIKTRFDNKSIVPTSVHAKLFSIPSNYIITTNYDSLIERAYVKIKGDIPNIYTYKDAASINYNLFEKEFFVLKAHGDSSRAPMEIVLTEKDYRRIIFNQKGYQSILQTLFSTSTILFLGVSLNDPEINQLLGFIHHIFHGGSPNHFALMPEDKMTKTEINRWYKDYHITIIPYNSVDKHRQLEEFLDGLIEKTN